MSTPNVAIEAPAQTREQQRDLWATRAYYLLFIGGSGFMSPFLSLFYIQLGLTGTQIGVVTALGSLVTLLAAPYWAQKSINWRTPRGILQVFIALTASGYLLLSQQATFIGVAIVSSFRSLVGAGISPISDAMALSVTGGTRSGYGSIRVWGSLGWIILVPLSGLIVQHTNLSISLVGAGLLTLVAAFILLAIKPENFSTQRIAGTANMRGVVRKLLKNKAMIGVALMMILIGLANSGVNQFETVYLKILGANDIVISIAGIMSAIVELPCMLWADRLVGRRGAYYLLTISMLMYVGLRLLVLLTPSIFSIMLTRFMQGVGFSFYTVALVRFVADQSAAHEKRTVLALYTVTITGLVSIIGAPVAGFAYDNLGPRSLYLIAAVGYFLAWACLRLARPSGGDGVETEVAT